MCFRLCVAGFPVQSTAQGGMFLKLDMTNRPATEQNQQHARTLYVISCLTDCLAMLLIFSVSRDLAERGAGLLRMGLVGGVLALTQGAGSMVAGPLSDRFGRRRLILGGILLSLAGSGGALLARVDTWQYLVCYWAVGVALGTTYAPLIAWLNQGRQDSSDHARARGISHTAVRFCLAWNAGLILGQLAGGWLFPYGRHWPMGLAAVAALINLCLLLRTGRQPTRPAAPSAGAELEPSSRQQAAAAFRRMAWIANLGGTFSVGIVFHLFPKLAKSLGIPSEDHGMMLALRRVTVVGTFLLMHAFGFWRYRFYPSLILQAAAVGGLVVLMWADHVGVLTVGLIGLAVLAGYNYFASLFYSSDAGTDRRRGLTSGIHEATLLLGLGAGAIIGGVAGELWGMRAPYVLAAAVICVLIIPQIVLYVRRVRPLRNADDSLKDF